MKNFGVLSKSDNGLIAESEGRFPATEIGRRLHIPGPAVAALAPHDGEYHHTGAYARETKYYSLAECQNYFESTVGRSALTAGDRSGITASMSNQLSDSLLVWAYSHKEEAK